MKYLNNILKMGHRLVTKNLLVIEAVEIREEGQSFFLYNLVLLDKKKQEINISKQASGLYITTLQSLLTDINTEHTASILIINSDKIYSNLADNEKDDLTLISTAIPGANAEEFHIYRYAVSEKKDFISIARKSQIDTIIADLNIPFINIAIGPFPLLVTYKLISASISKSTNTFTIGSYNFNFYNDTLVDFSKANQQISFYENNLNLTIGEKSIPTSLLISFSFGLYYYLNPAGEPFATKRIKNNFQEYTYQKIGKLITLGSLMLLFICLTASSILYTVYSKKYNDLELKYSAILTQQQKIKLLNVSYEKEQQIYNQLGILTSSKISYFLDQLVYSLPDDVYIRKLDVHPALGRSLENAKFSYQTIFVEGNCFSGNDLNNWINTLKRISWIKNITIKQYHQSNQNEIGNFFIEITTA